MKLMSGSSHAKLDPARGRKPARKSGAPSPDQKSGRQERGDAIAQRVEAPCVPMRIPRATYRLQLNAGFRLDDARALIPYLQELGISHVYASPLFKSCPGSAHGYDACDLNELNPELGSAA